MVPKDLDLSYIVLGLVEVEELLEYFEIGSLKEQVYEFVQMLSFLSWFEKFTLSCSGGMDGR